MQVSTMMQKRRVRHVCARIQFHNCPTGHRDKLDGSLAHIFREKRDATAKEIMHKSRIIRINSAQHIRAR